MDRVSQTKHGSRKTVTTVGGGRSQKNSRIVSPSARIFVLEVSDLMNDPNIFMQDSSTDTHEVIFKGLSYYPGSNTLAFRESNLGGVELNELRRLSDSIENVDVSVRGKFLGFFEHKNGFKGLRIDGTRTQEECVLKALAVSPNLRRIILDSVPLKDIQKLPRLIVTANLVRLKLNRLRFHSRVVAVAFFRVMNKCESLRIYEMKDAETRVKGKVFSISGIMADNLVESSISSLLLSHGFITGRRLNFTIAGGDAISSKAHAVYWLCQLRKLNCCMSIEFTIPHMDFKMKDFYNVDAIKALEATVRPYYLNPALWVNSTLGDIIG